MHLGMLLAMADVSKASQSGSEDNPVINAPIGEAVMTAMAARVGHPMPVGNEGAGVVIATTRNLFFKKKSELIIFFLKFFSALNTLAIFA